MADPFQDVDAAGPEFIAAFADSMDVRQSDPTMEAIVADYLGRLRFSDQTLTIEIGAGAGAVTRRVAARAAPGRVIGFEPSSGFVEEARKRAGDHANLEFTVADGAALPLEAGSVDHAVMHTVLSHVTEPSTLLAEAHRVLKPGGTVVVCDADFSKSAMGNFPDDPLDACARTFVREFVTEAHMGAKARPLLQEAGFVVDAFNVTSRVVLDGKQMLPWVVETCKLMVARGEIGQPLADALAAESARRAEAGTFYGYQAFVTAIARRSD
ncbi:MAG: methyltransferase domain-containing protein [Pseudomonadota bacterium]